jgi:DNA-binding NarL/FixJ family response regulator
LIPARSSDESIRVLLVDDHEIVLHGLSEFIGSQEGLVVSASATTAASALDALSAGPTDIALLDVRLPDMDGISLCREIRSRHPDTRCLMLSSFGSEEATLEAVVAGASGYLLKDSALDVVVDMIRAVAAGKTLLDPALTSKALDELRRRKVDPTANLTSQERRVLDLLSEGLTNDEIAERLHLAPQTIKNYVSTVLTKLGMRRIEAALYTSSHRIDAGS